MLVIRIVREHFEEEEFFLEDDVDNVHNKPDDYGEE